jgi:hypothetical protein
MEGEISDHNKALMVDRIPLTGNMDFFSLKGAHA